MLSGLIFRLSPMRRRFMRDLATPAIEKLRARLADSGSPAAVKFISTLSDANSDFMAFALSPSGPLGGYRAAARPDSVERCLSDLLIYAVNVFAREEMARDPSELVILLSRVLGAEPKSVMLRRDQLRKSPRSEEWMLYTWLVKDLGGAAPTYDAELERRFGYQYVSYIGQYREMLGREMVRAEME
jgi:hypothetical protein